MDEVSIAYGMYWLRLRWPGPRGGVAGYMDLGTVQSVSQSSLGRWRTVSEMDGTTTSGERETVMVANRVATTESFPPEEADEDPTSTAASSPPFPNDATSPNQRQDAEPLLPDPPSSSATSHSITQPLLCESTGLPFPSTPEMELLHVYDDGMTPPSSELSADENDKDDVSVNSDSPLSGGEPVFCRICREGLHEVNYDYDTAAEGGEGGRIRGRVSAVNDVAALERLGAGGRVVPPNIVPPPPPPPPLQQNVATGVDPPVGAMTRVAEAYPMGGGPVASRPSLNQSSPQSRVTVSNTTGDEDSIATRTRQRQRRSLGDPPAGDSGDPATSTIMCQPCPTTSPQALMQPIQNHHPYAENPLLAPCDCAGSMKFVHYLCIEQWRNRSNHPAARGGLNCETCHAEYTLPPPPQRPAAGGVGGEPGEDWLEAMPPHVMNALRRPHLGWQIGAFIVRQRRLRPLAPILVSPIVALYCRARRTLKKKGVSRRRWACSLCRRRARWKCVRCLRSYYCSRQCQNVSWHIVHKHVCYKPSRFYWSCVLYGIGLIWFVPGVLAYPIIYDSGVTMLWTSFVVMGTLGGGMATVLKKKFGLDIRGRMLEAVVVLMTLWLANVGWGLVWAFFGEGDCRGVRERFSTARHIQGLHKFTKGLLPTFSFLPTLSAELDSVAPKIVRSLILQPSKMTLELMDRTLLKTSPVITEWICSMGETNDASNDTCLAMTQKSNPDFLFETESCRSDLNIVATFWIMAAITILGGMFFKRRDNRRRAAARAVPVARARQILRPHQD